MEVEFILCKNCKDGKIENEGVESVCPVCDGDPKITYELVKEYARQIDKLSKIINDARLV